MGKISHEAMRALLTVFQILLCRYTGQEDLLVGTPIANRTRAEIEDLIGFFANTLVLRTQCKGNPSFRTVLKSVRNTTLEAHEHQDVPFDRLVELVQPERTLSHNPLFQVLFSVRNVEETSVQLKNLSVQWIDFDDEIAKFDLSLLFIEETKGLCGVVKYTTSIFNRETIERFIAHYQVVLERMLAQPTQNIHDFSLLTPSEHCQMLEDWNTTGRTSTTDSCIHQLFERQAALIPDAIAVVAGEKQLTYRELNQRANQIAHYLKSLGVGPEVLVGLYVERSLEMLSGLLGILKAGGAYVPLDPGNPPARIMSMLHNIGGPVLLTQAHLRSRLPELEVPIVSLDTDWQTIALESTDNPPYSSTGENTAYAIYTSGSTGQPKGVLVEHRQILHYLRAIQERMEFVPGSNFAMVQPLTFDSCLTVVYPSLCLGGCLHIISREQSTDTVLLAEYFRNHTIDVMKITPSHLAALQSVGPPEQVMPRSRLILGGEASRWKWMQTLQDLAGDCVIFNHYGPTETTVGVLTCRVKDTITRQNAPTPPLGRPLANIQTYILDTSMQPQPIGVPGELFIGGSGVTRGYLHNPGLTAERFVPDPFSTIRGARIYKTGDIARPPKIS